MAGPGPKYIIQAQPSLALLPWLFPLVHSIMQLAADVVRLLQLMLLFAPVVCWAPLAIYYNIHRPQWLQLFRCGLLPCINA